MGTSILNEPVLILNVNFEPLHVCNTKRALSLVIAGKAEIVLNGRGMIHSASDAFELPSIIKLQYMSSGHARAFRLASAKFCGGIISRANIAGAKATI